MGGVELAAPLGVAQAEPVGGPVAGAGEARLFYKGLEQDWFVAVAMQPLVWELACSEPEEPGGQMPGGDPGEDEEPRVVDYQGCRRAAR